MKVTIHITKGARGRFWWQIRDYEDGTSIAISPSPGEETSHDALVAAKEVITAELVQVHTSDKRWWQFWRD